MTVVRARDAFLIRHSGLHPQNPAEVFVNAPRALALGAPGEELSRLSRHLAFEDQLIGPAAAAGAGLSMKLSPNRPNFSELLVHGPPPRWDVIVR